MFVNKPGLGFLKVLMPCCRKIKPSEEKQAISKMFVVFNILQSIAIMILCSISIHFFSKANISSFIPVDIVTLFIAVIILSLILIVVGWSSAISNTSLAWTVFHCFMFILLIIELAVCLFTSNADGFIVSAGKNWVQSDFETRMEMQSDLNCCGFQNSTDNPAGDCASKTDKGCKESMSELFISLRNVASVAMFVCFVFGLFIDFAGFALCYHPETFTLEDQAREEKTIEGAMLLRKSTNEFINPFSGVSYE